MWRVLTDLDVDRLCDLFSGDSDHAHCDAGCVLDIRLSLVFCDTENRHILVAPGDQVDPAQHDALVPDGHTDMVEVVEDADALRHRVRTLLKARLATFGPAIGEQQPDVVRYLNEEWRRLTPGVFAAVAAMLTGRLPFARLILFVEQDADPTVIQQRAADMFAARQFLVWFSMLYDWIHGDGHGSFEADLRRYVDNMVLLNGSVEHFLELIDQIPGIRDEDLSGGDWVYFYQKEALRASLCARIGRSNPNSDVWAYLWLAWELRRQAMDPDTASVPEVTVSVQRVRATVPPDSARFAAGEMINEAGRAPGVDVNQLLERLESIYLEFGYQEQYRSIIEGLEIGGPVEDVAEHVLRLLRQDWPDRAVARRLAERWARPLVRAGRVDDLRRIADAMRAAGDGDDAAIWLCWQLHLMGKPALLLAELGNLGSREDTVVMRVEALQAMGRHAEALAALDAVPAQAMTKPEARRQHLLLRAKLLRQTGSPAAALTALETLLAEHEDPPPELYESLSSTYLRFGRYEDAERYGRQAYTVALRDRTRFSPERFAAVAMMCQALAGRIPDDALFDSVRDPAKGAAPFSLVVAACALLMDPPPQGTPRREFVDRVAAAAPDVADQAEADENVQLLSFALYLVARHTQAYHPDAALEPWVMALVRPWRRFGTVMQDTYLYAVAQTLRSDGRADARPLLDRALDVATAGLGQDSPFGLSVLAGRRSDEIDAVTGAVYADDDSSPADLRLVGELRRGVAGRRKRTDRSPSLPWRHRALADDVVAAIAPPTGAVGVLEWSTDGTEIRCLLTVVSADDTVTGTAVPLPDVDLERLGLRLRYQLSNWRCGRPGDPFDDPAWHICRTWLARLLDDRLGPEDHLVVLPFTHWWQMPWHVAAFDLVSCSYEPGWLALLDTVTGTARKEQWVEGVVAVPRVGDSAEITTAMDDYVATVTGDGPACVLTGSTGDREAVRAMLETVDLATLLTHGYVSVADTEVALMLAAEGELPLAHAVAADSTYGRRHRFGWREYAELTHAPQVVLSAACGTGGSHVVGAGEQLGCYNVLRHVGLRAFVAPRWDIVAADVLPALAELRRLLRGGTGLGRGLRTVTRQALDGGTPPWLAHALALEGDWR